MAPKRKKPVNARLKALRTRLKLSQTEMAEKFRVTLRTYQRFESSAQLDGPAAIVLEMLETLEKQSSR